MSNDLCIFFEVNFWSKQAPPLLLQIEATPRCCILQLLLSCCCCIGSRLLLLNWRFSLALEGSVNFLLEVRLWLAHRVASIHITIRTSSEGLISLTNALSLRRRGGIQSRLNPSTRLLHLLQGSIAACRSQNLTVFAAGTVLTKHKRTRAVPCTTIDVAYLV